MEYNADEDFYVCANGKKIIVSGERKQKTKTGYETWKTQYSCENCSHCTLKTQCIHGNRSIQSEGTFANVKANLQFRRFLGRGKINALVESMLMAMAHNIGKIHHKIQSSRSGQYLFSVNNAA